MNQPLRFFPLVLAIAIILLAIWSSINPFSRAVWYAEVLPTLATLGAITALIIFYLVRTDKKCVLF